MKGSVSPKRLSIFCEGPTEQQFCSQVLQSHLFPKGEGIIHTLATGKMNFRHVHGISNYLPLKRFICNRLKGQSGGELRFTTMIDLYGLRIDFPGKKNSKRNPNNPTPYVLALEDAFGKDINDSRFIPYLQLHEFETMLFADVDLFAEEFEKCDKAINSHKKVVTQFPTIEHIDDGPPTAPSKRICREIPTYQGRKTTAGVQIAKLIGVKKIRAACPHFDQWLTRLETLEWGDV